MNDCYLLPWSEKDNPNGWIEPTTFCNLSCPGCYRGCDKDGHEATHTPFEEVIQQIDWLLEHRNIHTLSISGGDPLLYPRVVDLVRYARGLGLRVMLYTNGLALTRDLLVELRDAGVTQFLVHVDRYQERPDKPPGRSVEDLQAVFCRLFREVGGVLLGFIQPLSSEFHEEDIRSISGMAARNADVVSLLVYTLYRDICWDEPVKESISTGLTMQETMKTYRRADGFVPAAYLHSEVNPAEPTWVFGTRLLSKGQVMGYFSPTLYRFAHERYRSRAGKYMFISRFHRVNPWSMLKLIFINGSAGLVARAFTRGALGSQVYFQTVLLLRGPEQKAGGWDLCQGCPDRVLHEGKLVPSCILQDIKKSGFARET